MHPAVPTHVPAGHRRWADASPAPIFAASALLVMAALGLFSGAWAFEQISGVSLAAFACVACAWRVAPGIATPDAATPDAATPDMAHADAPTPVAPTPLAAPDRVPAIAASLRVGAGPLAAEVAALRALAAEPEPAAVTPPRPAPATRAGLDTRDEATRDAVRAAAIASEAAHAVEAAGATIGAMSDEVAAIGTILSLIRGVASQTDMLALNALIEAARAGDQGRGFKIVADEVKALARKTAQATSQMSGRLDAMRRAGAAAADAVARLGGRVEAVGAVASAVARQSEQAADLTARLAAAEAEALVMAEHISGLRATLADRAAYETVLRDKAGALAAAAGVYVELVERTLGAG